MSIKIGQVYEATNGVRWIVQFQSSSKNVFVATQADPEGVEEIYVTEESLKENGYRLIEEEGAR